jgi:hypothetical protein
MKWVKYVACGLGYSISFVVLMIISTQVIDNFITGNQIQRFAQFFGIQDIEGTLDLYVDTSIAISALLSIGIIWLCRLFIRYR